ncbi:MAG: hypothetical protein E6K65_11010 [Nitrospirae bacterium]|nr:MAG: hypothetical protein E6K65_11010 [Nitrospirota bacterium]
MKHLIISVVIIWAFFQISSLIWSSKGQPASATFTRLLEPPQHRLLDPYQNGYYYLLGFAAADSLDPAKVGHQMWLETTAAPGTSEFNYDKPGRSELQIELPMEQVLPSWNSQNPVREFRNMKARLQTLTGRDHTLLVRYERWIEMPFEDMGFGHQGTPRFVEIFVGHRFYIADGFSRQTALGMQRLKKDMHTWRSVLRDATTIDTKVMAQIFITDDLRLLSTLLSQPTVNKTVLAMTPNIAPPLTTAESSLRWPLQHQFTLGVHGEHTGELTTERQTESLDTHEERLASAAHLPKQAFLQIAHPHGRSFLGISLRTREIWEMYATYYDAMIHAEETGQSTMPKLYELAGTARQGIVESLVSPNSFEPDWDPFHYQLRETDARLRLASLQVVLRRPSAQTTVPNRLAQVGSSYYDPFSGLPMLWSPTQQKIYSVGKDRYDDGGDVSFDISVPAIVSLAPAPKESQATAPTRRTNRH